MQCQLRRSFSTSGQFYDLFKKNQEFTKSRENTNAKLQSSFLDNQNKYKKDTDTNETRHYQQSSLQSSPFSLDSSKESLYKRQDPYKRQDSYTKPGARLKFGERNESRDNEYALNSSMNPPQRRPDGKKFSEMKEYNTNIKLTSKTRYIMIMIILIIMWNFTEFSKHIFFFS